MGWYIICWMQMFNYSGKSNRLEYWYFVGLSLVVLSLLNIVLLQFSWAMTVIYAVISINLLPYFAVLVRRIRDAGYNPWCVGWRFVPIIGQAVLIYITTRPSCDGVGGKCIFRKATSPETVPGAGGLTD